MDPGVLAMLKNTQKYPVYLGFPGLVDPGILTPGTQTPESRGSCPPLGGNYHPGPGRGKGEGRASSQETPSRPRQRTSQPATFFLVRFRAQSGQPISGIFADQN